MAMYMTHVDRAVRRTKAVEMVREGMTPAQVSERLGLSVPWIRQTAKRAGLSLARGRPRGSIGWRECPPHLLEEYIFLTRFKRVSTPEARRMLEQVA